MKPDTKKSLFDFNDYREYLQAALPTRGEGRGSRNRLAETLGCQKAFISLVLSGRTHFSLEHASRASQALGHDETEQDYFLMLVHRGRAGSEDLKRYYDARIESILKRRNSVSARVATSQRLKSEDQATYYSSWHYTAVHMCLFLPGMNSSKALARRLGLPLSKINEVVEFLLRTGLAARNGDAITAGPARIHLPADSPLVARHHTNWRMQAIRALDETGESNLHYSLVMSLDQAAVTQIREILLNSVQRAEPVLKEARDELCYALNIDLFAVSRI